MEEFRDPERFLERAEKFARENGLFEGLEGKCVLAAFSGGADSSVLLRILRYFGEKYGFSVRAMHVHHGIRGEFADRDEEFSRKTCEELGIPFASVHCDVPAYAKEFSLGVEEAARELRYRALRAHARENGIEKIAVAHNLTDNLETVLFHLSRGASGQGLSGIAPKTGDLIRPILFASKREILAFADLNGIGFVRDETNEDTNYTRNYIRSEIVPAIEKLNPRAADAALRTGEQLRRDEKYLSELAERFVDETDVSRLSELDDAILSRVIRKKAEACGPPALSYEKTYAIVGIIRGSGRLSSVSAAAKTDAVVENGRFYFGKRPETDVSFAPYYERKLVIGENPIPEADAFFLLADEVTEKTLETVRNLQNIYNLFIRKSLVFDNIVGSLFARPRMPSDRYLINGVRKSVKKYMCDEKFDPAKRFDVPFLCDGFGIAWIPGLRERDGLHPKDGQTRLLHVFYFQFLR